MNKKEISEESLNRKVRRNEVNFSKIESGLKNESLENYVHRNSRVMNEVKTLEEIFDENVNKRVLYESISKLKKEQQEILLDYMDNVKQVDIAEKHGKSPSAIRQQLDKIIYDYRILLCSHPNFKNTSQHDDIKNTSKQALKKYLKSVQKSGKLNFDISQIQSFISEAKKAIKRSNLIDESIDIKKAMTKPLQFKLTDKQVEEFNAKFKEIGLDADFSKLKNYKGSMLDALNEVDGFLTKLNENSEKID